MIQVVTSGCVDGLYYEITGAGHPLVLIHSMMTHSGLWDEQVAALAPHYRVIRYDVSGFGKSPAKPTSDSDDLKRLLKHLNIKKTYVLGISMGAEIALQFALDYPDMVDGLMLASSGLDGYQQSEQARRNWQQFINPIRSRDFETAKRVFIDQWVDGPIAPASAYVRERVKKLMDGYTFSAFFAPHHRLTPHQPARPAIDRLSEINIPTMIMVGERDQADVAAVGNILARKITGARKVIINGAGHMINLERPLEFNRLVMGFRGGL